MNAKSAKQEWLVPGLVILLLSLVSLGLTVFPMLSAGIQATHFTQDPDMAYLGNGLNFLLRGQIHFILHPGIPTQLLIAAINLPFLIYSKMNGVSFEEWIYHNFDQVVYFNRVAQSLLLSISIGLWLLVFWKMTKTFWSLLLAWCFLFVYREIPTYGMALLNENTSFLILSIWLLILSDFVNETAPPLSKYYLLVIVSALGLSNKFTNIFMPMIAFALPLISQEPNLRYRLKLFFRLSIVFLVSFALFLWPIRHELVGVWNWLVSLATHTGIYGTGQKSMFDSTAYFTSLREVVLTNTNTYLILLGCLGAMSVYAIKRKPHFRFYWVLIGVTVIITAVFSKYVVVRYQLFMILTIYLFGVDAFHRLILPKLKKRAWIPAMVFIAIMIPIIKDNIETQYRSIGLQLTAAQAMSDYAAKTPEGTGTVVEIAFMRDYGFFFVRDWSNGFLNAQLAKYREKLFTFKPPYFQTVMNTKLAIFPTMDACWDRLIIQNDSVQGFLTSNSAYQFGTEKIPNTTTTVIKSTHCQTPLF